MFRTGISSQASMQFIRVGFLGPSSGLAFATLKTKHVGACIHSPKVQTSMISAATLIPYPKPFQGLWYLCPGAKVVFTQFSRNFGERWLRGPENASAQVLRIFLSLDHKASCTGNEFLSSRQKTWGKFSSVGKFISFPSSHYGSFLKPFCMWKWFLTERELQVQGKYSPSKGSENVLADLGVFGCLSCTCFKKENKGEA